MERLTVVFLFLACILASILAASQANAQQDITVTPETNFESTCVIGLGCAPDTFVYTVTNPNSLDISVMISANPPDAATVLPIVMVPAMNSAQVSVSINPAATSQAVGITFTFGAQSIERTIELNVLPSCTDTFSSATAISGANGSIFGTNVGATGEPGEPNHAGTSAPLNSVWCKWTASANGPVTFDTTGSDFDTTLAVYTGTTVTNLTLVTSNNDISGSDHRSRVTVNAVQGVTYRIVVDGVGTATGSYLLNWAQAAAGATTFAAVLPYARSVLKGVTATAFATIINGGNATAIGCAPAEPSGFPATFTYQTTNAANQLTGSPNTPVNIAPQAAQGYVFGLTPSQYLSAAEIGVVFACSNTPVTVSVIGLNTFILSASPTPSPDIVAIGVTPTNDGIVNIPGNNGTGFFAAAGVNIGSTASITASADDGGHGLPVTLTICQTDPGTGQCLSPPAASTTTIFGSNSTLTFTVFVQGNGNVPFDPANNRLFLRFKDAGGGTRGATNVAVRTN